MIVPQNQNYMEVNLGGQLRKVKMGMATYQKVATWLLEDPQGIFNPVTRPLKAVFFGLQHSANALPKDFNEETLMDWIDDMEQSEWDALEVFAEESMGFMLATINQKAERMENLMQTMEKK